jgi:hypothetical protein
MTVDYNQDIFQIFPKQSRPLTGRLFIYLNNEVDYDNFLRRIVGEIL